MNRESIIEHAKSRGYDLDINDKVLAFSKKGFAVIIDPVRMIITQISAGGKGHNFVSETTIEKVSKFLLR